MARMWHVAEPSERSSAHATASKYRFVHPATLAGEPGHLDHRPIVKALLPSI